MIRTIRQAAVLGMLVTIAATSGPTPQAAGDVAVTVTYKGKGKVDATAPGLLPTRP